MPRQTNVASFVLRFVQETSDASPDFDRTPWRGLIKHVQSNDELQFTSFADAIAFISGYVDLDDRPADVKRDP
jgi:hypothetical protein